MNRRTAIALSTFGLVSVGTILSAANSNNKNSSGDLPSNKKMNDLNLDPNPKTIERLELDDKEWQDRLEPLAYDVLRKEGTERPIHKPAK